MATQPYLYFSCLAKQLITVIGVLEPVLSIYWAVVIVAQSTSASESLACWHESRARRVSLKLRSAIW